jgi:hypothetical protein
LLVLRIKAVVLGFFSRHDEDLLDVCPPWSGWNVEFWKAPSANSLGHIMPKDCWIGWNSVVCIHVWGPCKTWLASLNKFEDGQCISLLIYLLFYCACRQAVKTLKKVKY